MRRIEILADLKRKFVSQRVGWSSPNALLPFAFDEMSVGKQLLCQHRKIRAALGLLRT